MDSRIFLSYARANADSVDGVAAALDAAGFNLWVDKREINPGDSWPERVNQGLTEASYLLVFFSAESAQSPWVTKEWTATLARRSVPILPVLLTGGSVPALLADIQYFDLRTNPDSGTRAIVEFFERELSAMPVHVVRGANPLAGANRRQLRLVATRCLDDAALAGFCFDAEVPPGSLAGGSLNERVVSLLHRAEIDGLTTQFVNWIVLEKGRCVTQGVRDLRERQLWEWKTD